MGNWVGAIVDAKQLIQSCDVFERCGPRAASVIRVTSGNNFDIVKQQTTWPKEILSKVVRDSRVDLEGISETSRQHLQAIMGGLSQVANSTARPIKGPRN